jgi:hypothetical protein
MTLDDYKKLSPFEQAVLDALRKLHEDNLAIEGQLVQLNKFDVDSLKIP